MFVELDPMRGGNMPAPSMSFFNTFAKPKRLATYSYLFIFGDSKVNEPEAPLAEFNATEICGSLVTYGIVRECLFDITWVVCGGRFCDISMVILSNEFPKPASFLSSSSNLCLFKMAFKVPYNEVLSRGDIDLMPS